MALIGDVVVKFAADFAQFSTNMTESTKQLERFGAMATETGGKVTGFISQVRALAVVTAVLWAGNEVVKWGQKTAEAAAEVEELGKKLGFTGDQIEAMQKNAKATGQTFDQNVAYFKKNREELEQLTARMREQGELMSGPTRAAFADINTQLEIFGRTVGVVRAEFQGGVVDTVASSIAKMIRDMASSLAYFEVYKGSIASVRELMAIFTGAGGLVGVTAAQRAEQHIDQLRTATVELTTELQRAQAAVRQAEQQSTTGTDAIRRQRDAILGGSGANQGQALADARARQAAVQAQLDAANKQLTDAEKAVEKAKEVQKKAAEAPTVVIPTTPTGGGGGGGGDRDNVEAQIRRYEALAKVAGQTQATISANRKKDLDDLQIELRVQQQTADIVEKLAARNQTLSAAQRERLETAVRLNETIRAANERALQDAQRAVDIEKRMGDGTEARADAIRDLNRALNTGRLSQEAYNREVVRTNEAIEQGALAATRYDDNLESLAAGFEAAMLRWQRANDLFSVGERAFTGLMGVMDETFDVLAGKSSKTFEDIASDFALMLAKMAAQAAASEIFGAILGSFGGQLGAGGMGPPTPGSGILGWLGGLFSFGGNRAAGGPVYPGTSYLVGENGPERFVPTAVGEIRPMNRSQDQVGGVVVNVDMRGAGNQPSSANGIEFGRRVRAAVMDVIQNEKRPGGTLHA